MSGEKQIGVINDKVVFLKWAELFNVTIYGQHAHSR